jgi:hypothetical protein
LIKDIDTSRGPFEVSAVPEACSSQDPNINKLALTNSPTNKLTNIEIKCIDKFKNEIKVGGEKFKVFLTVNINKNDTAKISTQVNTNIIDKKDGTYMIEFTPPLGGEYSMVIDLNGKLYGSTIVFDIKDNICKPGQRACPNKTDKCVNNILDCIIEKSACTNLETPFYCSVQGVKKCVRSQTECDCPEGYLKCYPNICVPKDKDYICSFWLPVQCKRLYPIAINQCEDGICRADSNDSPSQPVCPIGFVLCPDLTCRTDHSKCFIHEDCGDNKIRCPNQSCVYDQKDCSSRITCNKPNMFVCPDGSCVDSDIYCNALPICGTPNSVLCPDNSCVSDIKYCPKQVSCGHTYSLCSDIICKSTCMKFNRLLFLS